jgi:hypothetical protein
MSAIYILKSESNCKDIYKVGICSNGRDKLISRYITQIPDVSVCFYYTTYNAKHLEKRIKHNLKEFRITNNNNIDSEWFNVHLDDLIDSIYMLNSYFRKIQHIKEEKNNIMINIKNLLVDGTKNIIDNMNNVMTNNKLNINYDFLIDKEDFVIHDFLFLPNISDKIKLNISEFFLREDNEYDNKFYNILCENKNISQFDQNEIIKFCYKNLYIDREARLEIIWWLNSLLGINNSTETKLIEKRNLIEISYIVLQNKQQIYNIFNIRDQSKNKQSQLTQTVDFINRIYKNWSGSELTARNQKRVTIKNEETGIKKLEDITAYDFGFKINEEYISIHQYMLGFKRKECQMNIENKEENAFFNMNSDIVTNEEITPVFNIVSSILPLSPLKEQIVPVFNILQT